MGVDEKEAFSNVENRVVSQKDFDTVVINDLLDNYFFRKADLAKIFGISRQRVDEKLPKCISSRDNWRNKTITEKEIRAIHKLVEDKAFTLECEDAKYYIYNNQKDKCVFICAYEYEIKCFYLEDLPETERLLLIENNFNRFSLNEIKAYPFGEIVYILKKPYLKPYNGNRFNALANKRNMSLDAYAKFLCGLPHVSTKEITDVKIIEFLELNLIDGKDKVYISSNKKNQWIRNYCSRKGYTLKEFVELYGYEFAKSDAYDKSISTRESHIAELQKYIVDGNIIYIESTSDIYRKLAGYAIRKGLKLDEYIKQLGFLRTNKRPITIDKKAEIESIENEINSKSLKGEEKESFIKRRVNQGIFRKLLLEKYSCCCLCGIENPVFLIASHIKPWAMSLPEEKLDSDNGLLLCANHDILFDGGYISFDDNGKILISDEVSENDKLLMNISEDKTIELTEMNKEYLAYHRKNLFKR